MVPSSNKSSNSPKNYKTMEEFNHALNQMFASSGITVNQKAQEEPPSSNKSTNSSGNYKTGEEFLKTLNSRIASSGITVKEKPQAEQQEPTDNSKKDWTKLETHQAEVKRIFDSYGITVNQKAQEEQQVPTDNPKTDTYQIQFFPKKQ